MAAQLSSSSSKSGAPSGSRPAADQQAADTLFLSVVVPVHNEEANLAPLIEEIRGAVAAEGAFEIIYVDDGSADGTLDGLKSLAAGLAPELRVLKHVTCCGQSAAIWTGIKAARAPLIATLDGDGQNDPADIPALLEKYRAERDYDQAGAPLMIAGQRAKRQDNWVRKASSALANGVRSRLLGDRTPDSGCGLKIFPRDAFLMMPRFDHMHRFLPALMLRQGGRVISVPVNHRPRERGQSKYGVWNRLWVSIADLCGMVWLISRGSKPVVIEETPDLDDPKTQQPERRP